MDIYQIPRTSCKAVLDRQVRACWAEMEETVLAVMSAGVPVSSISITAPALEFCGKEKTYKVVAAVNLIRGMGL